LFGKASPRAELPFRFRSLKKAESWRRASKDLKVLKGLKVLKVLRVSMAQVMTWI
jgi:hypothetical protein